MQQRAAKMSAVLNDKGALRAITSSPATLSQKRAIESWLPMVLTAAQVELLNETHRDLLNAEGVERIEGGAIVSAAEWESAESGRAHGLALSISVALTFDGSGPLSIPHEILTEVTKAMWPGSAAYEGVPSIVDEVSIETDGGWKILAVRALEMNHASQSPSVAVA